MNILQKLLYNSTLVRSIYHSPVGMLGYHLPMDLWDFLRGRRDPMVPPRWKTYTGRGDFRSVGLKYCRLFVQYAGLQPDDSVLEVGSGIGRMAVGLTEYLSEKAQYHGLEIVKSGVEWCEKRITGRFPNFHFHHADIYNKMYNRNGKYPPHEYRFPFDDEAFDFVFLTSVFTHMLPQDIKHYLAEIRRVLKRGKRCLITINLINDFSLSRIREGKTDLNFKYRFGDFYSVSGKTPEFNIALGEQWLREALKKACLTICGPVRYGSWSGRTESETVQDVIIACS